MELSMVYCDQSTITDAAFQHSTNLSSIDTDGETDGCDQLSPASGTFVVAALQRYNGSMRTYAVLEVCCFTSCGTNWNPGVQTGVTPGFQFSVSSRLLALECVPHVVQPYMGIGWLVLNTKITIEELNSALAVTPRSVR
eukprot:gb/GECG01003760.1/.p1 GENE.gb/GECG01003760.1/~~gb/GECG01003760.1/.p1  ORF type:complete len:139 (+),score=9.32 gb/GECG01003760.1/:1-417(+)